LDQAPQLLLPSLVDEKFAVWNEIHEIYGEKSAWKNGLDNLRAPGPASEFSFGLH
jgi:hypothetical protein